MPFYGLHFIPIGGFEGLSTNHDKSFSLKRDDAM